MKRILALLLCAAMLVCMLPTAAFAADSSVLSNFAKLLNLGGSSTQSNLLTLLTGLSGTGAATTQSELLSLLMGLSGNGTASSQLELLQLLTGLSGTGTSSGKSGLFSLINGLTGKKSSTTQSDLLSLLTGLTGTGASTTQSNLLSLLTGLSGTSTATSQSELLSLLTGLSGTGTATSQSELLSLLTGLTGTGTATSQSELLSLISGLTGTSGTTSTSDSSSQILSLLEDMLGTGGTSGTSSTSTTTTKVEILLSPAKTGYSSCDKASGCNLSEFKDLDAKKWYHDGIHYCVENGLIQGFPGNEFRPDGNITRAQLLTIVWRLAGKPVVDFELTVSDVTNDQFNSWYFDAVKWAYAYGICSGASSEKFGPSDELTREQFATILCNYAKYRGVDVSTIAAKIDSLKYEDINDISLKDTVGMYFCIGVGVISGNNGKLNPGSKTTRAEASAMLQRFCEIK